MTTYLTAQSLSLSHATTLLFKEVTFTLSANNKIGLVGHNGCGKSSLLKVLSGLVEPTIGSVARAKRCLVSYVEQHLPESVSQFTVLQALEERLADEEHWQAQRLLNELGFAEHEQQMPVANCSGGQQMRLLLARAVITSPDLLLLDEPSNHLDLPSLLWLENFLKQWKGAFVLVSHDRQLLDTTTNTTWIMRDQTLYCFELPCSAAREALSEKDRTDELRHVSEQKEIDRIERSAKRLAEWGKVYDNEDLARKAKTMTARKERLEEQQTELSSGPPWTLSLQGDALPANRLLEINRCTVKPKQSEVTLFNAEYFQLKSGDRVAIMGANGTGKSSLLEQLYQQFHHELRAVHDMDDSAPIRFHPNADLGYYDQSLHQLNDGDSLIKALAQFASVDDQTRKMALISAGFDYQRHAQNVASLSGGERARLLFVGLSLARYHLLFLDEPTNHLDLEGKQELWQTLNGYQGAALIVSHDRELIEQGCNRFWLIRDGELVEVLEVEDAYQQIRSQVLPSTEVTSSNRSAGEAASLFARAAQNDEQLLERLLELESKLEADLQRKPKHQKPSLQQQWREEIETIEAML